MKQIATAFRGSGLMARVLRSSSWLVIGYGGSQAMRLAANLILTRLLFPEAFGLMALVMVAVMGLGLFSDVGIGTSIAQNPRGDDPEFLNTAWTIQIARGVILFVAACLLAKPVAGFYGEADLALYLPIAALSLLLAGFYPTRIETANRHLLVGRLTGLTLLSQGLGIAVVIIVAWATGSAIALVLGGVAEAAFRLTLTHFFLPGPANRLRWDRSAALEILHFGKWIFLSTGLTFVVSQSDRAILGRYLSLDMLGIYNIGYFLGSFPMMLGMAVSTKLMIPVYRDKPVRGNRDNWRKIRRLRWAMTVGLSALLLAMALAGPGLAALLYDDRYLLSGPILSLVAISLIPQVIGMTYDDAALAAGDARSFFVLMLARAVVRVATIMAALAAFGLIGAIAALGLSVVLVYPVQAWLAARHHAWDPVHDALAALVCALLSAAVIAVHWDSFTGLAGF
ncbi:Membrane protein involved in the export of O-antigen and teichoic acid [Cribrihabitans marinus]|uniref:Membrane protein involved in the export of O-antigen and teichoic acid n=1 Tax=Cribrihabitans marinus TaxID=1227549 RepID=A0A1H6SLG5_9RHOB|nr:oligosaccharide flippase family protein [Cribrihabitans marinus]GGH23186.1 lipopolysaccharide biosynthesis protein [Cribrihabitans marinus]SEI68729.1 Membrane protein involved in the export of O-antigen and teichoic acid [Cribrihabitans marinus]